MALLQTLKPINVPQAVQQALDLHRQGKLPQAEQLYSEVLAVRPDYFEALHMLGLVKLQRGDLSGALRLLSGAMQARPKSPEVLLNYGLVLNALGRHDEAVVTFGLVLSIKRRSVEAYNNRGAVLESLGRNDEAIADFERALEIKSGHLDSLYNYGSLLRKIGRHAEALKYLDRVVALKPNYTKAHNNRGAALESMERIEEALISYDRAATINPAHAEVLNNRSTVLATLGRHREALASVIQATAVNPNFANAQWNEALLKLRLGDLAGGFAKYEWRWKRDESPNKPRKYDQPLWLGETPIEGKTIFVHSEQGFGDTIQFARYATMLTQRGARVILEVQPPLKSLLSQLGAGVQVIGSGEEIPSFDMYCPLLSLALALRTELATIPADVPYLSVPGERIAQWAERLPKRDGLRVGLVWSGNAIHKDDHNRSIALARLAPLFDTPGIEFVSLQKDLREADAQLLAADARIVDAGRNFDDFTDTAAAVSIVDLVISVDTSVAHLAGALGKPVWVLLPFNPDWRWLVERDDSPWYPTARLFRQPGIGDWDTVLAQVRDALSEHAARHTG